MSLPKGNLNTSYVKVKLYCFNPNFCKLSYLNTSYVKVKLCQTSQFFYKHTYLNTSYVKVKLHEALASPILS